MDKSLQTINIYWQNFNCVQQSVTVTCGITDFKSVQKSVNNRTRVLNHPCLRWFWLGLFVFRLVEIVSARLQNDSYWINIIGGACSPYILHITNLIWRWSMMLMTTRVLWERFLQMRLIWIKLVDIWRTFKIRSSSRMTSDQRACSHFFTIGIGW